MKKCLIIVLAVLMSLTACTNRTPIWILPPGVLYPDNEPAPEPCKHLELEATDWFDDGQHYPSAGKCKSCGESVTRTSIEIGTAEELATLGEDLSKFYDIGCYTVSIIDDIDMSTEKEWPYINLDGSKVPYNKKDFVVNGNGHSIKNLSTGDTTTTQNSGFIANIWSAVTLEINNLTLIEATVTADSGSSNGVGGFIGYMQATESVKLNNCHVIDSTISGGHWTGGIYGYGAGYSGKDGPVFTNILIEGCSVEGTNISSINASTGGIMGHAGGDKDTAITVENTKVIDCEITSTGNKEGDIKAGNILGTNGIGDTVLKNVTFENNDVTSDDTVVTEAYGRLEFGTNNDGSLTIDDVKISG